MISKIIKTLTKRKEKLKNRLDSSPYVSEAPVFSQQPLRFEMSERISAIHYGGLGFIRELINKIKLPELINESLSLLKIHQPYHESDHVLNLVYNFLCGGDCLDDLKLLRNNESYLNALQAKRIPDPTTAGDFLRRFGYDDILKLLKIMNQANRRVLEISSGGKKRRFGILDIDSTIQETYGECKEGMDMSYKGKWGFHPLVITEATTGLHIGLLNRPGNQVSQADARKWIDYAVSEIENNFETIYLRGDSAFSLTKNFDAWDENNIQFCFACNTTEAMVNLAKNLPKNSWKRIPKTRNISFTGKRKHNYKEEKVIKRNYANNRLFREDVAEFRYRPGKCKKEYRVIALKKTLKVTKGQLNLFNEDRYFFYITNIEDMSQEEVLEFIRQRCNHENKLEQLKNGVPSLKMPTADFNANWAYMIMGAIAWNIKSWFGLLYADAAKGAILIQMEFKRFLNSIIFIPCQILSSGRQTIYRFLNFNSWFLDSLKTIESLR